MKQNHHTKIILIPFLNWKESVEAWQFANCLDRQTCCIHTQRLLLRQDPPKRDYFTRRRPLQKSRSAKIVTFSEVKKETKKVLDDHPYQKLNHCKSNTQTSNDLSQEKSNPAIKHIPLKRKNEKKSKPLSKLVKKTTLTVA